MKTSQTRIALMSNAGGSGKTTLAINLAYELAHVGHSVCLFGFDPNASLTMFVGLDEPPPEQTLDYVLSRGFKGDWPLFDCWPDRTDKVQACLGGLVMTQTAEQLTTADRKTEILMDRLEDYPLPHDYLIYDCPGTIDIFHKIALTASDFVLIPVQPDNKDMLGAGTLLSWIFEMISVLRLRPAPQILGVVPNRVRLSDRAAHRDNLGLSTRARTENDSPSLPEILQSMQIHCFKMIKDSAEIGNAASLGLPLKAHRPGHAANKNFQAIVKALMEAKK
ncbi:MAG: ParA family protein [Cyanobacteria bacterium J06639_14]